MLLLQQAAACCCSGCVCWWVPQSYAVLQLRVGCWWLAVSNLRVTQHQMRRAHTKSAAGDSRRQLGLLSPASATAATAQPKIC